MCLQKVVASASCARLILLNKEEFSSLYHQLPENNDDALWLFDAGDTTDIVNLASLPNYSLQVFFNKK